MFIRTPYNLRNRIGETSVFFGDKPAPVNHSFEKHLGETYIVKTCKKVSAGIGVIKRAKPYVDISTLRKTLVQPYFDY